jgi:hypothetical protein
MHIPPGFNTVTPYFFVDDAAGFIDFLVAGLGGTEILRHLDGKRIANAQVQLGTSAVMVSEASAAFPAMPASYYLYVENADESMSRAPPRSWPSPTCPTVIARVVSATGTATCGGSPSGRSPVRTETAAARVKNSYCVEARCERSNTGSRHPSSPSSLLPRSGDSRSSCPGSRRA